MDWEEYIEYLKSSDWRDRRKELMEEAGWTCSECGDKAKQLHHLNYNNLGNEELEFDVVALCTDCHKEIHNNKDGFEDYGDYGT